LKRREQAELTVGDLPKNWLAAYNAAKDEVTVDLKKLLGFVEKNVEMVKEFYPELKEEEVLVAKFASLMSHEIIHRILGQLFGNEVSRGFDQLYFMEFMEKLPPDSIEIVLWSDALETCPIGDTWFG
jgi:hypothetical protein